jgi:hypothetical protein
LALWVLGHFARFGFSETGIFFFAAVVKIVTAIAPKINKYHRTTDLGVQVLCIESCGTLLIRYSPKNGLYPTTNQ